MLRVVGLFVLLWCLLSAVVPCAHAQTSTVGQSTSTSSTTEGARKSFFDSSSNTHWVFWYNGTAVEYASSPDGTTWTSRGTLTYNTPNFTITHKVLGGTSYVFLVSEANTYDVVMRRGSISGTSVSFDSEETVLDGTSSSDAYIRPHVVCDTNGKVWTVAFKDLGNVGDRYHLTARRTTNRGDQTLSFNAATSMGKPSVSVTSVAMVPTGGEKMLAAVSGESGSNVVTYEFDGAGWNLAGTGGEFGAISFASAAPGVDGTVYAVAVDGAGNLYVAGIINTAGGAPVNNIAKWNGTSWSGLGSGVNTTVYALAVDTAGNLYAGGSISTAGGVSVGRIAKWDGTSWSGLGTGLDGTVYALKFDSLGNLYVGGQFTNAGGGAANRVAKWDGSSWSALGAGTSGSVYALAVDSSNNVYVGGAFTTAGGSSRSRIAKWSGTSWGSLGTGVSTTVYSLTVDGSGNLYAGGDFTTAGGVTVNRIAKWDGASWSALGTGMNGRVSALTCDSSGNLYAGGWFDQAGGQGAGYLAKWSGSSWSALPAGPDGVVVALALDADGDLHVGGAMSSVENQRITGAVATWNGTSWQAIGVPEIDSFVTTMVVAASGDLYAGGYFGAAGGSIVNRVAKWNGTSWSPLGSGVDGPVSALALDGSGNLYVAGAFSSAGGVAVNNIARWDGTSWFALGAGVTGGILSLAVDLSGNVYAGGEFAAAGGVAANNIAKWDGSVWSPLGAGMNDAVISLALHPSGTLFAGGPFTEVDGIAAQYIAQWNGTTWSPLGEPLNNYLSTILVDATGNLYAGGYFTAAGGVALNRIGVWNGTSWSALGSGVDNAVIRLAADSSGNIYAAGINAARISRWNGTSWSEVGAVNVQGVQALAADSTGALYVSHDRDDVRLMAIRRMPVPNLLTGTSASLVSGSDGTAYLTYIDANNDLMLKSYSSSSGTWSAATSVVAGSITSHASGIYEGSSALVSWFIEDGEVKHTEANWPYTSWYPPTSVSSDATAKNISLPLTSGTAGDMVAVWNRVGGSAAEVASALSLMPATPTPTPTMTATVTATATPTVTPTATPTFTPTVPAPPPPDIDFGQPGEQRQGPNIVVRGRTVVLSGTGMVGYTVEVLVDGIVVGRVPITASSGGQTGAWTYTLPALAPGEREIATVNVASEIDRSAPSTPVKVLIVAAAPLDFTGVGDTAITTWRRARNEVRFKIRRASSAAWTTQTMPGRYPVIADYDDDGVSDVAAVGVRDGSLEWNVILSKTGEREKVSVGAAGDTVVAGCNFRANKGASFAVFKSETRELQFKSLGESASRQSVLNGLGSCNVIGCGDTDGDGVDELLFTTRGADNRIRVVGYDTSGKRRFESRYNSFVRGFVVDRPNSSVPLVAVIGGAERRGRQVKITTMAGSFAFPRFFVERGATIGNGTFTTENNQQVSGIFWANRKNRMVSRRLLARGERSTELFKLPKGYSLVRPQGVVRTEGGR
jgi:hypothetical protein